MHYRIDVECFLCSVAEFFDVPVTQVQVWIQPEPKPDPAPIDEADSDQTIGRKQPIPNDRNDQPQVAKAAKTITGINQQNKHAKQEQTLLQQGVVAAQAGNGKDQSTLRRELQNIGIF